MSSPTKSPIEIVELPRHRRVAGGRTVSLDEGPRPHLPGRSWPSSSPCLLHAASSGGRKTLDQRWRRAPSWCRGEASSTRFVSYARACRRKIGPIKGHARRPARARRLGDDIGCVTGLNDDIEPVAGGDQYAGAESANVNPMGRFAWGTACWALLEPSVRRRWLHALPTPPQATLHAGAR